MPDTMTLQQLSEYLQMSVDSVYHLVRRGKIPGIKIGKQWRFSKKAIDRWLTSKSTKAARILVVENNAVIGDMLLNALHTRAHQAVGVETSEQAAALLGQVVFDVVILSLSLPDHSAVNVIQHIQGLSERPEILVISSYEDAAILQQVLQILPYVTVLHKPLNLDAVVDLVTRQSSRG